MNRRERAARFEAEEIAGARETELAMNLVARHAPEHPADATTPDEPDVA